KLPRETNPQRANRITAGTNASNNSRALKQPRIAASGRKGAKRSSRPKLRLPPLSIIDSQSVVDQDPASLPDFIKIAMRHARKSSDQGRHSPTGKFIRLQTAADTEEANRTLRDWRANKLMQRSRSNHKLSAQRPPLAERFANEQRRPPKQTVLPKTGSYQRSR